MPSFSWLTAACALLGSYLLFYVIPALLPSQKLRHIPSIGCRSDSVIDYWVGAFKFLNNAFETVQEGYHKFGGRPFKVPTISGWIVVVSDAKQIEEMKTAKDDSLSMIAAVEDSIQVKYTLGMQVAINSYHISVIRTPLTRNMQYYYPEIRDEIITAFQEEMMIPDDGEWHQIAILNRVMRVVSRTSNRLFVGLPACRDKEYIKLVTEFTVSVIATSFFVNLFPRVLRPLVGRLVGPLAPNVRKLKRLLGPTIEERIAKYREHGKDWEGKPNDLISWLIDYAAGPEPLDAENIVLRILSVNFAAIHTTTMAYTNALFDLAARPQYIEPLREEVRKVVEAEGWSKASIGKMRKLDSFVKESQRMGGTGVIALTRRAMNDFTFSDGTAIPAGATVGIAALDIQTDSKYYSSPREFDGFRFSDLREIEGEATKHHCVALDPTYFIFGMGRHACPGRFFAILEVKNLLAHTLLNYDIKFEDNRRPANEKLAHFSQPSSKAKISIRKRQGNTEDMPC